MSNVLQKNINIRRLLISIWWRVAIFKCALYIKVFEVNEPPMTILN